MTHATPRPWKVHENKVYEGLSINDGRTITVCDSAPRGRADAALIVRAVNTLDEAKAVLHTLLKTINRERDDSLFGEFLDTEDKLRSVYWPELAKQADKAKALLAEMEG